MTVPLDDIYRRRDAARAPPIWIAISLSVLLHAAVFSEWLPPIRPLTPEELESPGLSPPLLVELARPRVAPPSPPAAPPPPVPRAKPSPAIEVPAPSRVPPVIALERAVPKAPPPAPPVIALKQPAPKRPARAAAPPPPPPAVAPTPKPEFEDLASYIEARRRARAAAAPAAPPDRPASPPIEDENTRASRIVEQNLGLNERMVFGYDPDHSGGVFNVELMGYDYAEFTFIGWNKDIRRVTKQRIEVRKGDNSDIRIAVVRRMIALIREYVQEDFLWDSRRLGYRTLSARPADNQALEDFLMEEFFGRAGPPP